MEDSFETIVLGASMAGLGYAHAHPGSLVLEPGGLLAPEFTAAFRPVEELVSLPESPLTESLLRTGVLSAGGRLDTLALSTGLFRFAREERLPVLLQARPVSVRPAPQGGYLLEFITCSGLRERHARYLLDTRPGKVKSKTLNLLCHDALPKTERQLYAQFPLGVRSFPGTAEGERIFCLSFSPEAPLPAAQKHVITGWRRAFPGGGPHITAIAFDFDCVPEKGKESLCGAAFQNPVEAFLAGSGISPSSLPDIVCREEKTL